MHIIIAGGRKFTDFALLCEEADKFIASLPIWYGDTVILSGGATGADRLGEMYAACRGYAVVVYPANWALHGKGAGFIRNTEMAQNADYLLAFWNGQSRGTQHMIDTAYQYGLGVCVVRYE